jgi:hypothetical protein
VLKRTAKNTVFADGVTGAPVLGGRQAATRTGWAPLGSERRSWTNVLTPSMSRERDPSQHPVLAPAPTAARRPGQAGDLPRHAAAVDSRLRVLATAGGTAARPCSTRRRHLSCGKWTSVRLDDGGEVPTAAFIPPTCCAHRQQA